MTDTRNPKKPLSPGETGGHPSPNSCTAGHDASRRRLAKAALASPLLLTLSTRPVWGNGRECTGSVLMSGNLSNPVLLNTCQGCSPGYWKPNGNGRGNGKFPCWNLTGYAPDAKFCTAFWYQCTNLDPNNPHPTVREQEQHAVLLMTLEEVLDLPGSGFGGMARAAAASLLNAIAMPELVLAQVIPDQGAVRRAMWEAVAQDGTINTDLPDGYYTTVKEELESYYDDSNDKNCALPANMAGCNKLAGL